MGSLGTETTVLATMAGSCLAGGANSCTRKSERKLDSLLLERYTKVGDQVTSTGILVGLRLCVLPSEILARWISDGGLRVVLRVESRWVEIKAERAKEGLVRGFLSALERSVFCASRDKTCRYCPQGEKLHFRKTWRPNRVVSTSP